MCDIGKKSLEYRIAEAASDYKLGLENSGFANVHGGVEALQAELFELVAQWEYAVNDGQ